MLGVNDKCGLSVLNEILITSEFSCTTNYYRLANQKDRPSRSSGPKPTAGETVHHWLVKGINSV